MPAQLPGLPGSVPVQTGPIGQTPFSPVGAPAIDQGILSSGAGDGTDAPRPPVAAATSAGANTAAMPMQDLVQHYLGQMTGQFLQANQPQATPDNAPKPPPSGATGGVLGPVDLPSVNSGVLG